MAKVALKALKALRALGKPYGKLYEELKKPYGKLYEELKSLEFHKGYAKMVGKFYLVAFGAFVGAFATSDINARFNIPAEELREVQNSVFQCASNTVKLLSAMKEARWRGGGLDGLDGETCGKYRELDAIAFQKVSQLRLLRTHLYTTTRSTTKTIQQWLQRWQ